MFTYSRGQSAEIESLKRQLVDTQVELNKQLDRSTHEKEATRQALHCAEVLRLENANLTARILELECHTTKHTSVILNDGLWQNTKDRS